MWRKMLLWVLDVLTLGVTARARAIARANAQVQKALELAAWAKSTGPRYTVVRPCYKDDPTVASYLAGVHTSPVWQWFLFQMREMFIKQSVECARQGKNTDIHMGSLVALDLICAEMAKSTAISEGLKTHASDSSE